MHDNDQVATAMRDAQTIGDDAEISRLHEITMDGWCETSGDVESPTNWFALVEDDGAWYVLTEDSNGFKYAWRMTDEDAARSVYDFLDSAYGEWLGDDDGVAIAPAGPIAS